MIYAILNNLVNISLTFMLLAILTVVVSYQVAFNYWKNRNVYTWKPKFPFGTAKDTILQRQPFGFDIVELYKDAKKRSLKYAGYYLFLKPIFVPVDKDLIKRMFIKDFEYFGDRISYVDEDNDPISTNLVHLHGDRWKMIRSIVRPFVSTKNIDTTFPLLRQCSNTLIKLIEAVVDKENSLDIKEVLDRYNIDALGAFFFRLDCNTMMNPDSTFKDRVSHFFNNSMKDALIRMFISVPAVVKFCKIKTYNSKIVEFFKQFIDNLTEIRRNQKENFNDVFKALTTNSIPLTRSEIIGNTAILLIGGFDTTSNTMGFCLYELAASKDLQDAVRLELTNVLEKHGGEYSYLVLNDLALLENCTKEALRKYTVCTYASRICKKDYPVPDSDLIISKGTHVYIPLRAIHLDPEFYPDPEAFDPERFAECNSKDRHTSAWVPFGAGPRHCIGYKVGSVLMKLALAVMLQNYEFSLHPSTKNPLQYNPRAYLLQSNDPIRLIVRKL